MGGQVSRSDFEWSYTEEPHASRRKEILAKYPQIKKLMGHDPNFKYTVTALVAFQFMMVCMVNSMSWPVLLLATYCISGVINHALLLAIHEIAHNLAFGHSRPFLNRMFGLFTNLPIGVPCATTFKTYHLEHHRYQGNEEIDMDLPSNFETKMFFNTITKFFWVLFQPFFYSLRPMFLRPKNPTVLEISNFVLIFAADAVIYYFFGGKALFYMIIGSLLGMGLHPVAGHFISEHYVFTPGVETYSYYGPLNYLTFNVGYHNEHHDFPSIPGSRLPQVKKIAPEYYDHLPHHTSWTKVIWDFIVDPSVGPYARVKRKPAPSKNGAAVNGDAKKES